MPYGWEKLQIWTSLMPILIFRWGGGGVIHCHMSRAVTNFQFKIFMKTEEKI